jgi:hypothetical protein
LGWILSPTTIGLSFAVNDAMGRTMRVVRAANSKIHADLGEDFNQ